MFWQTHTFRWALAVGYSAFLITYLLQQPGTPAVEVVAPVANPDWQREVVFTIGHIVGFGMLFALWLVALRPHLTRHAALTAFSIATTIGLTAEYLQNLLPDRTASVYDVAMNTIGMLLAWALLRWGPGFITQRV